MADKKERNIVSFLKQKDYEVINDSLGRGSFGVTVLLRDPFIDELFVAKKYEPSEEDIKTEYYKNFLEEIKILHKLSHPNIVRIFNYYAYEKHSTGYILMEYIKGKNIADFLSELPDSDNRFELDSVFSQIIDAFCCIEANGIIHRDIREGNILVTDDGVVKIIDFGIGKNLNNVITESIERDSLAREINRPSTLPQEYHEKRYTIKTDMFYIGELFNRLVRPLLQGGGSLTFSYQSVVDKMMSERPENRFESFAEIKELLSQNALNSLSVTTADKEIYKNFVDSYYFCIAEFSEPPQYNKETVFISKLEKVLRENIFEDYVQDNSSLIRCLIKSRCSYSTREEMVAVKDLSNFIEWYKRHDKEAREIIVSNITNKMNRIKVSVNYDDIPF